MKIGLIFGTFNPVHKGHIHIGESALEYMDAVIYVLTPLSPDKIHNSNIVSYEHRMEMLKLATSYNSRMSVSDVENGLPTPTRTANTLLELKKIYQNDELYLIFGSDNINTMDNWYLYDEVISKYRLIGHVRDGVELNKKVDIKIVSSVYISSSLIRGNKEMYMEYIPYNVYNYIVGNNLY